MLCWRSVTSTRAAVEAVGILKVPSSLAMMLDLDLAYEIFCVVQQAAHVSERKIKSHHRPPKELKPV
jgi:hypothetical protein